MGEKEWYTNKVQDYVFSVDRPFSQRYVASQTSVKKDTVAYVFREMKCVKFNSGEMHELKFNPLTDSRGQEVCNGCHFSQGGTSMCSRYLGAVAKDR